jgi:PAS domain S-box-containing protein
MKPDSGILRLGSVEVGSEEQYRLLLECVTDYAIFLLDTEGRITTWNRGAERLLGYREAEAVGQSFGRFFTLEDVARGQPETELATAAAKDRTSEDRWHVRKDGSRFWVTGTTVALRDRQGRLRGYARVVHDRREQRQAEEMRFRLSSIVESSEDAIIGKSLDGTIMSWNAGAQRLLGYAAEEIVAKPFAQLVPPDQLDELTRVLARVKADQPIEPYETVRVKKDGTRVCVSVSVSPIRDATGRIVGASTIARDITAHKRAEEMQLRLARQAVLRAEVALALAEKDGSFRRILQRCAAALVRHLDVDFAHIWILDTERNTLKLRGGASKEAEMDGSPRRVPPGTLALGPIAQKRQPYFTTDVINDPCISNKTWVKQEGIVSFTAYPLLLEDSLVGVIALLSRKPASEDLLGVLASVADSLAQGIERWRAEERLHESERRFRQLAENIREVFWMVDPRSSTSLYVSPAYEEIWGRSRSSIYDNWGSFLDSVHPDDRARVADAVSRQAAGEAVEQEYRIVRPDGSVRWIHDRGYPIKDRSGQFYRVAGIAEDITERQRAEEERAQLLLREQQARARAEAAARRANFLAKASTVLASSLDYETTLASVARLAVPHVADWCSVDLLAGDGSLRQLGVAHADASKIELAHEWRRRYPPDTHKLGLLVNVVRTGESALVPEITEELLAARISDPEQLRLVREQGLCSLMIVPLVARDRTLGAITFVTSESGIHYGTDDLALAEDLARRAALAIDNAHLYQEVREADRRKDDFMAMLAHELRNPLAPVRNALHVQRMPGVDAATAGRAQAIIERQVRHLTRLVDDLLDASRIARNKIQLRPERLNLARLLRTTAEDRRTMVEEAGLALVVETPDAPVWVEGDATRLAQVLNNLLDNAAKFTDRGGTVTVQLTADAERGQAACRVRDTGIGIEPELLHRLFDIFAQGDRSLDRSRGGLGLGLAVVRGLIQLHGGEVEASSEGPGRGAEFTIRLPLTGEPDSTTETPVVTDTQAAPLRVLVIEDNADSADSLRMLLEMQGHEVRLAATGPEGVLVAEAWRPDVVLCDIGLPGGLDGYGVARELRRNPATAQARLIALTGYGQEHDRVRAQEAKFDYHLTKPCEPAVLQNLLTSSLPESG